MRVQLGQLNTGIHGKGTVVKSVVRLERLCKVMGYKDYFGYLFEITKKKPHTSYSDLYIFSDFIMYMSTEQGKIATSPLGQYSDHHDTTLLLVSLTVSCRKISYLNYIYL